MKFSVHVIRFGFTALEEIRFPEAKGGNVIRGAFGHAFRRVSTPDVYDYMFAPVVAEGPSGMRERPRPYVIRASRLDGRTIAPGHTFDFDMHMFLREAGPISEVVKEAFQVASVEGFGAARGRAIMLDPSNRLVTLDLDLPTCPVERLAVHFDTPTELKQAGAVVDRPDFGILFARARDRVSTIAALYGGVTLDLDYGGLGERAQAVHTWRSAMRRVNVERRSSRTEQRHGIGGLVGEAEYEGNLGEFVPILKAAEWTGVGRQTVWGKGAIRVLLQ